MAETSIQGVYRKALKDEEERLPEELRAPWRRERKRRIVTLEEAREEALSVHLNPTLKQRVRPSEWAPATALILISSVNRLLSSGAMLSDPCTCFHELVQRPTMVRLLTGPLKDLGGPSKILLLRSVRTFSERILRRPVDGLEVAMLRIRANEVARDYSGVLKDYAEYRAAALALEPTMLPDEPHDLTSAIMTREKAIACIAVSVDPRLGEISGLRVDHVVVDGDDVTVVIPAEASKERRSQSRALDTDCGKPVIEYVCRARPYLSQLRPEGNPESSALWLTRKGGPLIQQGVDQALSLGLANAIGVPVGSRILRKVMASRDDIAEAQIGAALGHAIGSLLGIDLYGARDIRKARRELTSYWETIDNATDSAAFRLL